MKPKSTPLKFTSVLSAAALFAAHPSSNAWAADESSPGQLSARDYKFVCKAAKDGAMEVKMGKLGEAKGNSQQVKDVGHIMVKDHEKASNELKQLAGQKGAALPSLPETNSMVFNHLGALSGVEFDRAYLRHMAADHKIDISLFKMEAADGDDANLKSWAAATLPTLESHLRMIQDVQGRDYNSASEPSSGGISRVSGGIVNESNGNSKNNADSPTSGISQISTNLQGADSSAGIVSPSNGNSKNNADSPTGGNSQTSTNLPGADGSAGIVSPSNGNSKNNADTDAAVTNK